MKKTYWYDWMWILTIITFALGFFNILFAWLSLVMFLTPLIMSIFFSSKNYCSKYCDRGRLFTLLGVKFGITLNNKTPKFMRTAWFRYGFLAFFMVMFMRMNYMVFLVVKGAPLKQVVTLLWTFKLPWNWVDVSFVPPGVAQFAFNFYGTMLTPTILGLILMILFKPRTWCVMCPMGTMTQGICKLKNIK